MEMDRPLAQHNRVCQGNRQSMHAVNLQGLSHTAFPAVPNIVPMAFGALNLSSKSKEARQLAEEQRRSKLAENGAGTKLQPLSSHLVDSHNEESPEHFLPLQPMPRTPCAKDEDNPLPMDMDADAPCTHMHDATGEASLAHPEEHEYVDLTLAEPLTPETPPASQPPGITQAEQGTSCCVSAPLGAHHHQSFAAAVEHPSIPASLRDVIDLTQCLPTSQASQHEHLPCTMAHDSGMASPTAMVSSFHASAAKEAPPQGFLAAAAAAGGASPNALTGIAESVPANETAEAMDTASPSPYICRQMMKDQMLAHEQRQPLQHSHACLEQQQQEDDTDYNRILFHQELEEVQVWQDEALQQQPPCHMLESYQQGGCPEQQQQQQHWSKQVVQQQHCAKQGLQQYRHQSEDLGQQQHHGQLQQQHGRLEQLQQQQHHGQQQQQGHLERQMQQGCLEQQMHPTRQEEEQQQPQHEGWWRGHMVQQSKNMWQQQQQPGVHMQQQQPVLHRQLQQQQHVYEQQEPRKHNLHQQHHAQRAHSPQDILMLQQQEQEQEHEACFQDAEEKQPCFTSARQLLVAEVAAAAAAAETPVPGPGPPDSAATSSCLAPVRHDCYVPGPPGAAAVAAAACSHPLHPPFSTAVTHMPHSGRAPPVTPAVAQVAGAGRPVSAHANQHVAASTAADVALSMQADAATAATAGAAGAAANIYPACGADRAALPPAMQRAAVTAPPMQLACVASVGTSAAVHAVHATTAPCRITRSAAQPAASVAAPGATATSQLAAGLGGGSIVSTQGPAVATREAPVAGVAAVVSADCNMEFWAAPVDVYEVFPFQKEALDFAAWCNSCSHSALKQLQQEAAKINFESFHARWRFMTAWMAKYPAQQQQQQEGRQQQQQQGVDQEQVQQQWQWQQQQQQGAQWQHQPQHGLQQQQWQAGQQQEQQQQGQARQQQQQQQQQGASGRNASSSSSSSGGRPLEHMRVFTEEYASRQGGYTRHFVVTTYQGVWRRYQRLGLLRRHWYEVIREDRPCHMYFDLEYSRSANPGVDGDALVDLVVSLIRRLFRENWGMELSDACFIELDSEVQSAAAGAAAEPEAARPAAAGLRQAAAAAPPVPGTAAAAVSDKWSRHLVVRVPGHAFASSRVVGACVTQLRQYHKAGQLWVAKEGDPDSRASFIDMAVYSRMRHFRMMWSCKGGKQAVLQATSRYAMACLPPGTSPSQQFLLSLICNVHPSVKLLQCSGMGDEDGGRAVALLPGSNLDVVRHEFNAQHPASGRSIKVSWIYGTDPQLQQCRQALYRVAWDALVFVERMATQEAKGEEAQVRSLAYCGDGGAVTYGMIGPGSHYCQRICRAHRSNHVYLLLDFATGGYCQKCYDPECAGYRSAWSLLPHSVWRSGELQPLLRPAHLKQQLPDDGSGAV